MNESILNRTITIASLFLILVPVGIACIVLGYGLGDNPCILCWQERTAIIIASLIGLFVSRYGFKPRYIGALILVSVYGLWAGLRHSSVHLIKDIGQGYSATVLGLHLYWWVLIIFAVILIFLALIIFLHGDSLNKFNQSVHWNKLNKITAYLFLVIMGFNIVQAFTQTGPIPFFGQSDPVHMSFNPKNIIWSTNHWSAPETLSARGKFAVTRPDFYKNKIVQPAVYKNQSSFTLTKIIQLPVEITGLATGVSYNPVSNIYAIITDNGWLYFLNDELKHIIASVKIDTLFSVALSNLAGITFDSENSVLVTADHKSFVRLIYDTKARLKDSYPHFREGTDGVRELKRGRFSTARIRYNYIAAITWDSYREEYVTVSLPAKKQNNFVVAKLSGQDYKLNSEAKITNTSKDYPIITGLVANENNLYMLSHSTNQILIMDLDNNEVKKSYDINAPENPQGLTIVNHGFVVLNAKQGKNSLHFFQ